MTVHILDIPEFPEQLREWLEDHLVDVHLAEVVSELLAVHGETSNPSSLDDVLGESRERILNRGLTSLTDQQCKTLLTQPRLLFALQDRVIEEGSRYWQHRANKAERQLLDLTEESDEEFLLEPAGNMPLAAMDANSSESTTRKRKLAGAHALSAEDNHSTRLRLKIISGAALAIALIALIGLFGWTSAKPQQPWGWLSEGALQPDLDASSYLESLASSGRQWFDKRPTNQRDLVARLDQLNAGCDKLILAPHEPLTEIDRTWLRDKCGAWKSNIEKHLSDLKSGKDPATIRTAADETVRKLINALRTKASQLRTSE